MGFAEAITDAQVREAKKREEELAEHIHVRGIPERHDLGGQLTLKEMFGVTGEAFDRITEAARTNRGKHGFNLQRPIRD